MSPALLISTPWVVYLGLAAGLLGLAGLWRIAPGRSAMLPGSSLAQHLAVLGAVLLFAVGGRQWGRAEGFALAALLLIAEVLLLRYGRLVSQFIEEGAES